MAPEPLPANLKLILPAARTVATEQPVPGCMGLHVDLDLGPRFKRLSSPSAFLCVLNFFRTCCTSNSSRGLVPMPGAP